MKQLIKVLGKWTLVEGLLSGILLISAIFAIFLKNISFVFIIFGGFFLHYIYYRLSARKLSKIEKEEALKITKKDIKNFQENSPSMEESIKTKLVPMGDRERYSLISRILYPEQYEIVLDIGCAEGIATSELVKKKKLVIGLDLSQKLVLQGKNKLKSSKKTNAEFIAGDAENLPFKSNSFHAIVCSEVIEHVLNPQYLLQEIDRVLIKDGLLILTTENATRMPITLNPLVWLEHILGIHFSSVLSRRSYIGYSNLMKNLSAKLFIHRDFTIKELKKEIYNSSNFIVIKEGSFEYPLTILLGYFFNLSFYNWMRIETALGKITILKYMGRHLVLMVLKTGKVETSKEEK